MAAMSVGETAVGRVPLRAVRFPGKYIQGPGAIRLLGAEAKSFGSRAFCILDRGIAEALRPKLQSAFGNDSELSTVTHGGNCTMAEIASLERQASKYRSDCIIGLGGGKALDTSKAVANSLNLPCMVVPTIAASDAPCSALAIIYNEDGSLDRAMHLARNPDVVVADTNIISAAPARFMAAGIGDGLATCIEANACRASGADNTYGFQGLELAFQIARLCEDTLFEFGERAIAECREGECGVATERVVEANILLSGLGFESCGVAAAHGIQDGLCELVETHSSLHGEKVAIGILGELLLQEVEGRAFNRYKSFMEKIGLPTTLRQIGIPSATHDQLHQVALRACRDGDIIHNEPMPVTPDMVVRVLRELA
jgi:glycerol dehydrogenase